MPEIRIGLVTDFFVRPVVAGVKVEGAVNLGDSIHIKGHTTDMELVVKSMQIDGADITEAKPGDIIGLKVADRVRHGDIIYKVTE